MDSLSRTHAHTHLNHNRTHLHAPHTRARARERALLTQNPRSRRDCCNSWSGALFFSTAPYTDVAASIATQRVKASGPDDGLSGAVPPRCSLVDQAVISRLACQTESVLLSILSRLSRGSRLVLSSSSSSTTVAAAAATVAVVVAVRGSGGGKEKAESGDGAHLRTPARPINRSPRARTHVHVTYVRTYARMHAPTLRAGHAESGPAEFHHTDDDAHVYTPAADPFLLRAALARFLLFSTCCSDGRSAEYPPGMRCTWSTAQRSGHSGDDLLASRFPSALIFFSSSRSRFFSPAPPSTTSRDVVRETRARRARQSSCSQVENPRVDIPRA